MKSTENVLRQSMANVFLDTNVFIDIIEKRKNIDRSHFENDTLFVSPLSVHILSYLYKYKMPEHKLDDFQKYFTLIPLDEKITQLALLGPTKDFEDNVQLQSAAQANCKFFLTQDKKLLSLGIFGKIRMAARIEKIAN